MSWHLPDDHDLSHLDAALRYCNRYDTAVDCGAHRGIWAAKLCDVFREVVAIEPSELADQIDTRATVIRSAVGKTEGRTGLKQGSDNSGQTHCVEGDDVSVIMLDSLSVSPSFLKIDVEGWELFVIQGGEKTIRQYKPVICFEENGLCSRYGVRLGESAQLLESWGYSFRRRCNKDYIYSC